MRSVREFYAESAWGLPFGAWGEDYTIVLNRHIGFDVERGGDVPALVAGRVVRVVDTGTMAHGVVTDIGGGLYLSYWHLADDALPRIGTDLAQGARVGRIATGPKSLPSSAVDFPGTAWKGQHTHIVLGTNPGSAYLFVPGHRTLDAFRDPLALIRKVLAGTAGGDAKPFDPNNPDTLPEDAMPHFHDPTQRIYWPNGFYTSYDAGVYAALKDYFVKGEIRPGTDGTVEREVWYANDFMASRNASAVAKAVELADNDADAAEIAKAVVKALPAPPVLPTVAQIATAVRDKFKTDPLK